MKTLTIIRHADALPSGGFSDDFNRKLSARGRSEAELISNFYCKVYSIIPDRMEVSTAVRTRETAGYFLKLWGKRFNEVHYNQDIYNAPADVLIDIIHSWNDSVEHAMIIGHNPAALSLVNHFIDDRPLMNFPPASLAVMRSESKWNEWKSCCATLEIYTEPRKLILTG